MAVLRIPEQDRTLTDPQAITEYLASVGIDYENWQASHPVASDAPAEEILEAYSEEIEEMKRRGGYVTADVIDIKPDTPNLDVMLDKFNKEHWHDEDEVRFIVKGSGLFHIHPENSPVIAIEVEEGDAIRVPRGTWHWFDLCQNRRIRAIRLFQDQSGWTPRYTDSGVDKGFEPVCMGPAYFPPESGAR